MPERHNTTEEELRINWKQFKEIFQIITRLINGKENISRTAYNLIPLNFSKFVYFLASSCL